MSPSVSNTPRTIRRAETDRDVEDFLEDYLEECAFAEFCSASCNDLMQLASGEHLTLGTPRGMAGDGPVADVPLTMSYGKP